MHTKKKGVYTTGSTGTTAFSTGTTTGRYVPPGTTGTSGTTGTTGVLEYPPTLYTVDSNSVGPVVVSFTDGSELDRRPGVGNTAKIVAENDECSSGPAAGGTGEVTNLGPDDSFGDAVTSAEATFTFTSAGTYKVCYNMPLFGYQSVGYLLSIGGATSPPTQYSAARIGVPSPPQWILTFLGGSGLDASNGGDAAKVVALGDDCQTGSGVAFPNITTK
jgi:hypothetical protein